MWHMIACKMSASLLCLNWIKNGMIFYRISELMLATLIQRYDKNHSISRTREVFNWFRSKIVGIFGVAIYTEINKNKKRTTPNRSAI